MTATSSDQEGFTYFDVHGGRIGVRAIELPGDRFARPDRLTDEDWHSAAILATARLKRCRIGTKQWMAHTATVEESTRRRRAAMQLVHGGAA